MGGKDESINGLSFLLVDLGRVERKGQRAWKKGGKGRTLGRIIRAARLAKMVYLFFISFSERTPHF